MAPSIASPFLSRTLPDSVGALPAVICETLTASETFAARQDVSSRAGSWVAAAFGCSDGSRLDALGGADPEADADTDAEAEAEPLALGSTLALGSVLADDAGGQLGDGLGDAVVDAEALGAPLAVADALGAAVVVALADVDGVAVVLALALAETDGVPLVVAPGVEVAVVDAVADADALGLLEGGSAAPSAPTAVSAFAGPETASSARPVPIRAEPMAVVRVRLRTARLLT